MNNKTDLNKIDFVEKYIGEKQDDTINNFNDQMNIISNEKTDYSREIDYYNKLERDKNINDNYIERLDNEKHATIYRINNFPTYVDDINYSNPLIYPKESDPYFHYLDKKNINPINTQVVKSKEYLNIDSQNRTIRAALNITDYFMVKNNGLEFIPNTNFFRIYFNSSIIYKQFKINEYIILRGLKSYTNYYENLDFFFTNGSSTVVIDIKPNFLTTIAYTDITILIEDFGIKNNQDTLETNYWKNIPIKLLNGLKKVFIVDNMNNKRLGFDLPINYYSSNDNDNILSSSCKIIFNSLGNYPINQINSDIPITEKNLSSFLIINNITQNYIEVLLTNTISLNNNILLDGYWENNNFYTGKNIQIGKIQGFVKNYQNSNNFSIFLDKTYNNIAKIRIISSEIPNIQKNIIFRKENNSKLSYISNDVNLNYIDKTNNRLYWSNVLDTGINFIELESGNYSYELLKQTIEKKVSQIKRNLIFNTNYSSKYNSIEVQFSEETNETKFKMFDIYNIPNCLIGFTSEISTNKNIFKIKIYFPNHNLKINDTVFISNSIDYYTIDKNYINIKTGHTVTNVINGDNFEITLNNINEIKSVGNTSGGYSIEIKKFAIFKLYFNFEDTFGNLIGFKFVGDKYSETVYSSQSNNYTISNYEPYYYDISSVLIVNYDIPSQNFITNFISETFTYMLLLVDGYNINNNPNGPSYFYKFLINNQTNSYLFNTFVDTPVYFNPPIKSLNELKLTLIYPNGGLVDMGNLNYSLTFEITTINNLPANTNITSFMSRI